MDNGQLAMECVETLRATFVVSQDIVSVQLNDNMIFFLYVFLVCLFENISLEYIIPFFCFFVKK